MHFEDRKIALDTPGSGVTPESVRLIWHDYREERLYAAMRKLKRLRSMYKKAESRRKSRLFAYVSLAAILVFGIVAGSLGQRHIMVVGVSLLLQVLLWFFIVWPWMTRRQFQVFARRFNRGDFGQAVMFSTDPAWEELNAALQSHGTSMEAIVRNPAANTAATPIIADYLNATPEIRRRLRADHPEQRNTRLTLLALREHAHEAARKIAKAD